MPEPFTPEKVASGLDHLRTAIDAHKQATQASVAAGAAVQADKAAQPPATERTS